MVLTVLFSLTVRQTGVWHDSKTLWSHALAVGHPSSVAHLNYGILLRREGRTDQAVEHYRAALDLRAASGDAWYALGNALKEQKEYAEAEAAYREAVKYMAQKNRAYLNLGNMYYNDLRRPDDAIAAYRAAIAHIESSPKIFSPGPYLALGVALKAKGDIDGARDALSVAQQYQQTQQRATKLLAAIGEGSEK
jgi:tetratricopeptide (TPR) repeat protein